MQNTSFGSWEIFIYCTQGQGSKGIIQLNYIHNNTTLNNFSHIDYNKWLKRVDTQLNKPTNKNSIKVPKLTEPTKKNLL